MVMAAPPIVNHNVEMELSLETRSVMMAIVTLRMAVVINAHGNVEIMPLIQLKNVMMVIDKMEMDVQLNASRKYVVTTGLILLLKNAMMENWRMEMGVQITVYHKFVETQDKILERNVMMAILRMGTDVHKIVKTNNVETE